MLDLGWIVVATDELDAGRVTGAAYSEGGRELTAVVVRRGAMAARDIIVPREHVVAAADGEVTLALAGEEIERFPDFRMERYLSPERDFEPPSGEDTSGVVVDAAPARFSGEPSNPATVGGAPFVVETIGNVPEGSVAYSNDQTVLLSDGQPIGEVRRLVHEGDRLSGLVVDSEGVWGSGKIVPVALVGVAAVDDLMLTVDRAGYDALPEAPVA